MGRHNDTNTLYMSIFLQAFGNRLGIYKSIFFLLVLNRQPQGFDLDLYIYRKRHYCGVPAVKRRCPELVAMAPKSVTSMYISHAEYTNQMYRAKKKTL